LRLAYIAEKRSEHPLAQAIVRRAKQVINEENIDPEFFDTIPGQGVIASVKDKTIVVGNEKLMKAYQIDLRSVNNIVNKLRKDGKTVIYVAIDSKLAGVIAIADTPRKYAREVISYLKRKGLKIVMLTGDNRITAKAIAKKLGIDEVIPKVLPEDKTNVIRDPSKEWRNSCYGW